MLDCLDFLWLLAWNWNIGFELKVELLSLVAWRAVLFDCVLCRIYTLST